MKESVSPVSIEGRKSKKESKRGKVTKNASLVSIEGRKCNILIRHHAIPPLAS